MRRKRSNMNNEEKENKEEIREKQGRGEALSKQQEGTRQKKVK